MLGRCACALISIAIIAVSIVNGQEKTLPIIRLDPALDELVLPDAKIERITETYGWTDGPVWVSAGGYLLFSDISANLIYKWAPGAARATVFLERSGFTGPDVTGVGPLQNNGHRDFYQIGSNGLTLDRQGMVVICAQADRQIVRLEQDGRRTVLAAQFEGKRLNSPNDVIFKSDGALYFTDPPAGLRGRTKIQRRSLTSMVCFC